ncbi:hypothetical protein [Mycolicibacterium phlei]
MPTRLAAAMVAAGVATAGVVVDAADDRAVPVVTTDVATASVITDWLVMGGNLVAGLSNGYRITSEARVSLPFDTAVAIVAGLQTPSLTPSLFSWLVQWYLNPSDNYMYGGTYARDFKTESLFLVLEALPEPLAAPLIGWLNELANGFGDFLESNLANPQPGAIAYDAVYNTDLGKLLTAAKDYLLLSPRLVADVGLYLAYLPAWLEGTVEKTLADPEDLPGLLTFLAYRTLGSAGFLGWVIRDLTAPLRALPGPIGEIATTFTNDVYDAINTYLSLLPPAVNPLAQTVIAAAGDSTAKPVEDESLPEPNDDDADAGAVVTQDLSEDTEPETEPETEVESAPATAFEGQVGQQVHAGGGHGGRTHRHRDGVADRRFREAGGHRRHRHRHRNRCRAG